TLSTAEQLKVDGDAFLAKGDYVNAVEKYRQAVDLEPTAIPPRFALGTAFSFLDKRAEATVQFRWVLARAGGSPTESQDARPRLGDQRARAGAPGRRRGYAPARAGTPRRSFAGR